MHRSFRSIVWITDEPEQDTREQPWKKWYTMVEDVKSRAYFVWPALIAGNGSSGNGAAELLSLGVDLSKPKPKPQDIKQSVSAD